LADETPWLTYRAIAWLEARLRPEMTVYEWGSGGSTLFFARRVAHVISVEHDATWHGQVRAALDGNRIANAVLRLIVPEDLPLEELATQRLPAEYLSGVPAMAGKSFEQYVRSIDVHDDMSFDLVLIDGRARMSCLRHCLTKVKPGGAVVLDNADYPRYQEALAQMRRELLAAWDEVNLEGAGPYSIFGWWRTVAWIRPSDTAPLHLAHSDGSGVLG
jgi:tRNA A58 N-methylase Trm61